MGTAKLQPSEDPFDSFEHVAQQVDLHWLLHARHYASNGYVNFRLLDHIVHACHWFEVAKQKQFFEASKRLFDMIVGLFLCFLTSPIFLLCFILVRLTSSGPAFYTQVRIGRYGTPFQIIKFRTMVGDADRRIPFVGNEMVGGLFKIGNDPRLTGFGRYLRRWSLDELPQLLNVIMGDMALVGPRPLPPEDSCTVPEEHYLRFAVRPGITGLWQVTARDSNDGRYKIKLDYDYVMSRGWRTDLKILAMTLPAVISGKGAR